MKNRRNIKKMTIVCAITGIMLPLLAAAQQETDNHAAYSNYNDALNAQQVAQREAQERNVMLGAGLARIESLEQQQNQMIASGSTNQQMLIETSLRSAEDMYMKDLSHMSGVSTPDIEGMHKAGVSWGDMAGELGVHVNSGQQASHGNNVMGGGTGTNSTREMNSSQYSGQDMANNDVNSMMSTSSGEIARATGRNTESGWAEGHGTGMQTTVGHDAGDGMISGASGLSNGMGSMDGGNHNSGGMGGGVGASGGGNSGDGGGMGGSSGGGGGHGGGGGGGGGGGRM